MLIILGVRVWIDHTATQDDNSAISVFVFDANEPGKRALFPLAKNALRKLRTIRHPDVLKFMDVVETDTLIYIMTEPIRPLCAALNDWTARGAQETEDWLIWGLHRVSVSEFLHHSFPWHFVKPSHRISR